MKRASLNFGLQLLVLLGCALPAWAADTITMGTLLDEMVDRSRLARLPEPSYTCKQSSSYDRGATSPKKKESWFANMDRSHFIRMEEREGRKEYVLMDADGPGAVVRFWATWHGPGGGEFSNGMLHVYLDGADKPVIEKHIADVIDKGALTTGPLSESVSPLTPYRWRGHNLYLPIPYAKHCKITYSADVLIDVGGRMGEALYYQINYRTYDKDVKVEPFTMASLEKYRSAIDRVQKKLLNPEPAEGKNAKSEKADGTLDPGDSHDTEIDGPAAITELSLAIEADDIDQALRSTIIEMTCDGERTVWAPVGDFFGLGHKMAPCKTWYTQVTEDGKMSCFWVMPFAESCKITLHNLGNQPVTVREGEAKYNDWKWDDRSMHFHSTWHQYSDVKTQTNKGAEAGAFDANYVNVEGRGVYVGDTLTIFNGHPSWWGEGDEKVYVDGEDFPSHFGTGTEDYYGYAWSNPNVFSSPFHAQPYGKGANKIDMAANSRYRALDAIPFEKSLHFDMEIWHSHETVIDFAPTTYFYARPGAKVNIEPDPDDAKLPVKHGQTTAHVPGAIEGESLKVVEKTGGETEIQEVSDWNWSGGGQLWWMDGKPGDKLTLEFNAPQEGKFKVVAELTKASDYAIVAASVNGKKSKEKIDRYFASVKHDPVELGTFELKKGANQLEVEIVGANEKAIKRHMFGLDFLKLEAAK